jgi:hypothetical protein
MKIHKKLAIAYFDARSIKNMTGCILAPTASRNEALSVHHRRIA